MIIKAQKAKLDGDDLENVIDLSINIGNSASPSTASITFMGNHAETVAETLKSNSLLEVGGVKFYGTEYSVSVTDGQGGLTSTLEMIDQSFDILDRYYVELNIANHGQGTVDGSAHDDYIFLGSEYYSYSRRHYQWNHELRTWEVNNSAVVANETLSSNAYLTMYAGYKKTYAKYQRAIKNIEVFQGSGGGTNFSSTCTDNEVEPADSLLLGGGPFASQAQTILNFPSMTNPYTNKGEIFYRANQIPRNIFGGNALFNATGSLRSVLSAIAGQVGKSWYWDCTKDHSGSGGVVASPDAKSVQPYDAVGHSYTKGVTRANSFADGLVYRRYMEGEEADYASNEWVDTRMGVHSSIFETIIGHQNLNKPSGDIGVQTLLYMELGEELYKAVYLATEGTAFNVTSFNKLDQAIIKSKAFAGNSQLAALVDGGTTVERDGSIITNSGGTHKFMSFAESEWISHLVAIRSNIDYMTIWRACGPAGRSGGAPETSRYPWKEYTLWWDATIRWVVLPDGTSEYYPVSHEVVSTKNTCFIKGSPQIYSPDDITKETSFGQILSLVSADTACDDGEALDLPIEDLSSGSSRPDAMHTIVGDNSTWSYEFPACLMEQLKEWGENAVIDVQNAIGPAEMGHQVDSYDFVASDQLKTYVVKNRSGIWEGGKWSSLLSSWEDLITAERVSIRSICKMSGMGYANDGLYSEGLHLRLCSNGKGKANWGIQSMESGAEVASNEIDQIRSFGGAQCVDKTPFISYTLYGEWDSISDIGDLDSISVTYGSSGISTSYSRSYRKSVSPSALLFAGHRGSGSQNIINLSSNFNRFSTRFKNAVYSRGNS